MSRLTYANVASTLALVLALGGGVVWAATELGRNSVKAKQLAPNSVGTSELKADAAKGDDVDESSLSQVPSAANAANAGHADAASIANAATSAATAAQADSAKNADALSGLAASSLIRVASANTANALAPNTNGTIVSTTIQAPIAGYLTIIGSADYSYGGADDQVECSLEIDDVAIANARRVFNINGTDAVDSVCATNATRQVAAGSHKIDLEAAQIDDADVGAGELSVIFTPFGADGTRP
jgi:hypothetical protein